MSSEKTPATAPVDAVVMRAERDATFEVAIFKWYQARSRELTSDPNHDEFQVRIDEHGKIFEAILTIKHTMLPEARQREVAEAILRSFCCDDDA